MSDQLLVAVDTTKLLSDKGLIAFIVAILCVVVVLYLSWTSGYANGYRDGQHTSRSEKPLRHGEQHTHKFIPPSARKGPRT